MCDTLENKPTKAVGDFELKVNELNGNTNLFKEMTEQVNNKKVVNKQKQYTLQNVDNLKIHIKVEPVDCDEQEESTLNISDGLYNIKHPSSSLIYSPALDLSNKAENPKNSDAFNEISVRQMQVLPLQSEDETSQSDKAENETSQSDLLNISVLLTKSRTRNRFRDDTLETMDDSTQDLLPQKRTRGTYECETCGLKFTGNYKLNRHIVTHTGAKPFECEICGSKFTRKERLTAHVKKHVIGKAERCKIYNKPCGRQRKLAKNRKITSYLDKANKFEYSGNVDGNTNEATPLSRIDCAQTSSNVKLEENSGPNNEFHDSLDKCSDAVPHGSVSEQSNCQETLSTLKESDPQEGPSVIDSGMQNLESLACMMIETLQRPKKSFKCDVCGLQFRGSYKFNRHKLIHTGEKPFECGVCDAKFTRRERLTAHMKKHDTNQVDILNEAADVSSTEIKSERDEVATSSVECSMDKDTELVEVIMAEVEGIDQGNPIIKNEKDFSSGSSPNTNTVSDADFIFIPQDMKSLPKRKNHCSTKLHKCDLCDKVFTGTYKLNRHKATHTGEKPFQCLICFASFARKDRFTCHVKKHMLTSQDKFDEISRFADSTNFKHKSDVEDANEMGNKNDNSIETAKDSDVKLECDICGKTVKNECGLIRHKRIHFEKRQYNCEICSKQFYKKYSLSRHMTTHTDDRPFICHLCGLGFPLFYKLNRHLRSHNEKPVVGDVWKCDICGFIFKKEETLLRHKLLHFGGKPYTCDACDKGFSSYRSLSMHKAVVHFQMKPFKCDKCDVSYAYKGDLTRHKLMHSGSKPYRCCVCGKAFEHTFKLTRHKKIHEVQRPFHCSVCGKGFLEITKHNKHLKSHANDKL